ncbi:MFS transporter [Marinobacter persicus]|uniref:MFS-type transporter involved in bile tolerance (Atg22 family) n=1 Tax=Marinobacter persicus TaxID=930118 RepID=A0A2S6G9M8_9GAMM|nr:MFS transporter [Marinobacter persicus]PPK53066.1 MFS-type transporter involved in bile tolerance (Atg22 family) [Marinobacter persicus]PPK55943.1 MFS-type transporter involved in bile tolerance (Atg22 family) [Marinobacter persicus]PPK59539.1 MFS-type transporter involved in bile tolerance (Atg22 family) [Marinobacter persicus]
MPATERSDNTRNPVEQLYGLIANEEDARVCKDIPEEACQEVPRNFFLILAANVLTKLGDLLISPKTVLAWLMSAVGAPALVAWLVPIRESGSLVPQMVIAAWVRRKAVRKGFWTIGSFGQAVSVVAMAASIWFLEGYAAGGGVIAALIVFSLARGFCSVAMKDVQGKCIPKTRRGRLSGLATTVGGTATVVLTVLLFWDRGDPSVGFYTILLLLAAVLWVIAGTLFANVEEYAGETGGGGNALTEAVKSLSLLRDDAPFRHFVITRALLLCSALASPYFVVLAQQESDIGWMLGVFLLASSLASSVSASFWGWAADTSSRRVMIRGAAMASGICLLVGLLALLLGPGFGGAWFYPIAFFVLSVAHAGVRLGRKTYLVDMAGGNKRTDYTAVSNTVIGVLLLVTGAFTAAISLISDVAVILVLGLMGLAGMLSAVRLKEVTED